MLYNVLKKLKFEGTLEIKDSNDNVHSFGNSIEFKWEPLRTSVYIVSNPYRHPIEILLAFY